MFKGDQRRDSRLLHNIHMDGLKMIQLCHLASLRQLQNVRVGVATEIPYKVKGERAHSRPIHL